MTTYQTMSGPSKTGQIEDYSTVNIQSLSSCIDISIVEPTVDICSWITSQGGIPISFGSVATLRSAYLHIVNLGFTVTFSHVSGARAYYLHQIGSGNSSTGCTFPIT